SDSGIGSAVVKRISEGKDPDAFFSASLILRLLIYGVIVLILFALRDRITDLNSTGLLPVLLLVVLVCILNSQVSTAIGGRNRLGLAATGSFANSLARIGTQVITVYLGFHIWGLVGGIVVGLVTEILIESRYVDLALTRFTGEHIRSIFAYSVWAFLIASGNMVFEYVANIVIAFFLAVSAVGVYGICWTFSSAAIFVTAALSNTLFVKVSRWSAAGDTALVADSLTRACSYSLIFSLPILVGGLLLGDQLLYYLYGASFSAGALPLAILIGMRVVQSVQQLFFIYLMAMDRARQAFIVMAGASIANLVLDLVLIPRYGLTGAAVAALVTIAVSGGFAYVQVTRVIPVRFDRETLMRVVIALAAMTAMVLLVKALPSPAIAAVPLGIVGAGALVYFGVLLKLDKKLREDALRTLRIRWI
ncbi:MAG: oligosaccharide flippase family protein, partial [Methanomicrobiales archaeon]|nr:oligosaccharide flippase family protein [Methanomicrobiales archaeon]